MIIIMKESASAKEIGSVETLPSSVQTPYSGERLSAQSRRQRLLI